MNLISCKGCGVVYDADFIGFPEDPYIEYEDGGCEIDKTKTVYDQYKEAFFLKVDCRICGTVIQSKEKA